MPTMKAIVIDQFVEVSTLMETPVIFDKLIPKA